MPRVQEVHPVETGLMQGCLRRTDFCDAFRAELPDQSETLDTLLQRMRRPGPRWIAALMKLRNRIVEPLGLKTKVPAEPSVGIFRVFARAADEILMGEDDRHLDFRVHVRLDTAEETRYVTVTTLVQFHNAMGRAYFAVVKPFHRIVVPAMIRYTLAHTSS